MRISDWSSDVCSSDLLRREGAGFGELAFDQGACGDGGGVENAVRVDIGGGVPDADLAVRAAREDDGKFLREGDRKSVVSGKSVSVRVDLGGCSTSTTKTKPTYILTFQLINIPH